MTKAKLIPKTAEIAELEAKLADLTNALQRERADAINLRRRHEEELTSLRDRIKANVVRDLLPVIDNLDRALKHTPADLLDNPYIKGIEVVSKQFDKSLEAIGVTRIMSVGQPFDPAVHEAVSMEEGNGSVEVVSEELQSGYKIGDEVIRHAMVRVTTQ